jgi:hypothetical protein
MSTETDEAAETPRPRLPLDRVTDPDLLRSLWKRVVRKHLRVLRFSEIELAKDALEHLGVEWELPTSLPTLQREVLAGRYRAGAPEIIRAAKSVGLTRPLAFLQPLDLLLYKAIVASAQATLLRESPSWTRLGRFDAREDDASPAESGWFRSWLKRQGQVWRITTNHEYVVETDIANFFPYVHLPGVLAHLLENSNLSAEVVRLLDHMLRQFSPMSEYRQMPTTGLPQENFDSSRVIAHTYLKVIDLEFEEEGRADRYSRFMDDIVIGADTESEALLLVQRVQFALERVGLYPNPAKTRIVPRNTFTTEYMKDENDYIGEISESLDKGLAFDMTELRGRVRAHMGIDRSSVRVWNRVLRRYLTVLRRLRDPMLIDQAFDLLQSTPDSARQLFDYLSVFSITPKKLTRLQGVLDNLGRVYEDIDLLAMEYLASAPNRKNQFFWSTIAAFGLERALAAIEISPRQAAAGFVVAGKFGGITALEPLDSELNTSLREDSVARQQALLVLLGKGILSMDEIETLPPYGGSQSLSHLAFLRALGSAEGRAVNLALGLLKPTRRTNPVRYAMRPRALFLAPILRESAPEQARVLGHYSNQLRKNIADLRDARSETWLDNIQN